MKNINYKLSNGTMQNIEVTDDFAVAYEEIERESYRARERYKWESRKHLTSLDGILDSHLYLSLARYDSLSISS